MPPVRRLPLSEPGVYVDDLFDYGKGEWCHLWSEDLEVLEAFARRLGLKPEWRQRSVGASGEFIHYDLTPGKRTAALKLGAQYKPLQAYVRERMRAKAP